MKRYFFLLLSTVLSSIIFFYLSLPTHDFPIPLPDSVQSLEEADTESTSRRAYFTNFNREDVLRHYQSAFRNVKILGITLFSYRLSYPPEDAFVLIRDQTRSTFLEEIVYPFRESIFVNGFKPKLAKDEIWYKGLHYDQKITVKYVKPSVLVRVPIAIIALLTCFLLVKELGFAGRDFVKSWFRRK